MRIMDFITAVSFGLICFRIGYTFGKDNNKSQNNIINSEKSPIVKPYEPKETVIYIKSPEAKGINRPKPIERKKPFSDF